MHNGATTTATSTAEFNPIATPAAAAAADEEVIDTSENVIRQRERTVAGVSFDHIGRSACPARLADNGAAGGWIDRNGIGVSRKGECKNSKESII